MEKSMLKIFHDSQSIEKIPMIHLELKGVNFFYFSLYSITLNTDSLCVNVISIFVDVIKRYKCSEELLFYSHYVEASSRSTRK